MLYLSNAPLIKVWEIVTKKKKKKKLIIVIVQWILTNNGFIFSRWEKKKSISLNQGTHLFQW